MFRLEVDIFESQAGSLFTIATDSDQNSTSYPELEFSSLSHYWYLSLGQQHISPGLC